MGKITDNEIIKALKYCHQVYGCDRCPLRNDTDKCEILNTYALDLLLRQKAEIERLREYNENLLTANTALSNEILDIKSEAIKEFAERLKQELSLLKKECRKFLDNNGAFAIDKARKKVDNLVKEMTEEDENG